MGRLNNEFSKKGFQRENSQVLEHEAVLEYNCDSTALDRWISKIMEQVIEKNHREQNGSSQVTLECKEYIYSRLYFLYPFWLSSKSILELKREFIKYA